MDVNNFFDTYLDVLKNHYVDYKGRVSREPFQKYVAVHLAILIGLGILGRFIGIFGWIQGLYGLAALVPTVCIFIRRLHDRGITGWGALGLLIPLLNIVLLIVFCFLEGDHGTNEYGPDPLGLRKRV